MGIAHFVCFTLLHTEDVFLLSNESWEPEAINILPQGGGREVPHDGQY